MSQFSKRVLLIGMTALYNISFLPSVFTNSPNHDLLPTQGNSTEHVQNIKPNPLQCNSCQYIGPRLIRLQHHVKTKHQGLRLKCTQCSYQSTESSNLKKHIDRSHKGITHTCDHCSKIFFAKSNLTNHMRKIHTNSKDRPTIKCDECDKEFFGKKSLSLHEKSIHMEIKHSCIQCDYKSSCKENLNHHIRVHHIVREKLNCSECPYVGKSKKTVKSSWRVKTPIEKILVKYH